MGNLAENVIQKWADYVNQSNFQKLLGLYAPDSTMIPTFFKKILLNSSEIQEYFFMLSEWETTVEIFEESFCTKRIDMGFLVNGEYTFKMNPLQNGKFLDLEVLQLIIPWCLGTQVKIGLEL